MLPKHKEQLTSKGYTVIENVITKEEATNLTCDAIEYLLERYPITEDFDTWKTSTVPYIRANGVLQWGGIPHCPTANRVRELMYPYYVDLWKTTDLITSLDGATVHPPKRRSILVDWAHVDQTYQSDGMDCVQGQMVLTDTTAAFRCTPGSHLQHSRILDLYKITKKSGFSKFNEEQVETLSQGFGNWQMPIIVPAGSIILWDSRTIHSSRLQTVEEQRTGSYERGDVDGWRCVFYCCYRPRTMYSKTNKRTLINAVAQGRGTNHSGTRLFPKHGRYTNQYTEEMLDRLLYPELQEVSDFILDHTFCTRELINNLRTVEVEKRSVDRQKRGGEDVGDELKDLNKQYRGIVNEYVGAM